MKKNFFLIIIALLFCNIIQLKAQETKLKNQISLHGSFYSFNASGDLRGFVMAAEYGYKTGKRFQLLPAVSFTNHYDEKRYFTVYNGVTYDQTIRFITSGFQAEAKAAYTLVEGKKVKVKLIAGTVVRMQYDSYPSGGYDVNYPGLTGYPGILYEFYEDSRTGNKFKEINIGYIVGPSVDYTFKNNWFVSSRFLMQNDTNADLIMSGFIGFGKRF